MAQANPADFLTDPLSDVTRKERRNLLLTSTSGILVAEMGLIPTHISALGIEFSSPAQLVFIKVVIATIIYFMIAFVIYGISDYFVWRKKYQDYLVNHELESRSWTQDDEYQYGEIHRNIPRAAWLYKLSKPVAFLRIFFEFIFPIAVGFTSISFLFR